MGIFGTCSRHGAALHRGQGCNEPAENSSNVVHIIVVLFAGACAKLKDEAKTRNYSKTRRLFGGLDLEMHVYELKRPFSVASFSSKGAGCQSASRSESRNSQILS